MPSKGITAIFCPAVVPSLTRTSSNSFSRRIRLAVTLLEPRIPTKAAKSSRLTNMLTQRATKSAMMTQPDFFIWAGPYAALYPSVSQAGDFSSEPPAACE